MYVILCFFLSNAIIDETTLDLIPGQLNSFVWFGFDTGGQIYLTFEISSPTASLNVGFYLCSPSEYLSLKSDFAISYCQLGSNKTVGCEVGQIMVSSDKEDQWIYKKKIKSFRTYDFVVTNCSPNWVSINITYELTNSGGEQLSFGILEIKYLMIGFIIAWGLLLVIWLLRYILVQRVKIMSVQFALIVNCVAWGSFSITFYIFLEKFSREGVPDQFLQNTSIGLLVASECCFFATAQMVSSGLGILVPTCEKIALFKVAFNILTIIFCYLLYIIFNGSIFYILSASYIIFLITYTCDICSLIKMTQTEINRMIDAGQEIIESPQWHQIRFFRTLITSFFLFLPGMCVISAIHQLYFYMPWVGIGAHMYTIFCCSVIFSSYLRFQKDSPYILSTMQSNQI